MPDLNTPIPAPQIPATGGEGNASKILRLDADDFAKELGLDTIVPEHPAQPRDTNGQFIAKDTVLADTTLAKTEQPQEETVVVDTTAEKPAETTEAEAPAPKPEEGEPKAETPASKPPLTKFTVLGADGKPVDLGEVKLQFKDNGQQVEQSLEKVVHLAQQNSHNARRVQSLTEQVTASTQNIQQYQDTIASYESNISRMFANPEMYEQARALWLEANSPEKVAERASAEVREVRQQQAAAAEAGQVAEFISGTILPSISQLAEQYGHVTEDDLLGRFALYVPAYQVNGKVPLANLPKLQTFVETELANWAASVHDQRAKAYGSAKAEADKSLQKERETSQALKRQVAKTLAPVGTAPGASQPKPTTITKASDVFKDPLFGGGAS